MREDVVSAARDALGENMLSCVSYSNAGSGRNTRGQILWFVFVGQEATPRLVARTIRDSRAEEVPAYVHADLVHLSTIDPELFARPYPSTPSVSLESFVDGRRMRNDQLDLEQVISRYIEFQKKAQLEGHVDIHAEITKLARSLLSEVDARTFLAACAPYAATSSLPAFVQHGDLTRDNVVITENGIRLIDCEHAHLTKVPGYDIYNLVSRVKSEDPHAWLDAYSSKLGFTFAENHHSLFPALHELLEAQKKSGRIREKVLHLEKLLSLLP